MLHDLMFGTYTSCTCIYYQKKPPQIGYTMYNQFEVGIFIELEANTHGYTGYIEPGQ